MSVNGVALIRGSMVFLVEKMSLKKIVSTKKENKTLVVPFIKLISIANTSFFITVSTVLLAIQLAFTCLKLTIETLERGAKYVQS